MARERLCWAPWTGPTNGRRVSRVMSYPCTSPTGSVMPDDAPTLRSQVPPRADRPGRAHPQPALVDLVGRVPRAPPERPSGSQPPTSLSRAGSCMPPVAPGRAPSGGGHRASGVTPQVALLSGVDGHPRAPPQARFLRPTWRHRLPGVPRHPAAAGRAGPAPRRRTC